MTGSSDIEVALHRFAAAQAVTAQHEALARWHESTVPGYEAGHRTPQHRRGVFVVCAAVAALILAALTSYGLTRHVGPSETASADLIGPSAPGEEVAVTARIGWLATRTADGWLVQHPSHWTVAENVICDGQKVILMVVDASTRDACAILNGLVGAGSSKGFVAVRHNDDVAEAPTMTTVDTRESPDTFVIERRYHHGTPIEVVGGGSEPAETLRLIASSLVAPRFAGDEKRPTESLVGSSRSLAETLAASHATTEGFDAILPKDLPISFHAARFDASATLAEARLADYGPDGDIRVLRICSGVASASNNCGGVPEGPTIQERGGRRWICADTGGLLDPTTCRMTEPGGAWVAFQVQSGSFTMGELDRALASLSPDLTGAAWASI